MWARWLHNPPVPSPALCSTGAWNPSPLFTPRSCGLRDDLWQASPISRPANQGRSCGLVAWPQPFASCLKLCTTAHESPTHWHSWAAKQLGRNFFSTRIPLCSTTQRDQCIVGILFVVHSCWGSSGIPPPPNLPLQLVGGHRYGSPEGVLEVWKRSSEDPPPVQANCSKFQIAPNGLLGKPLECTI